MFSKEDGLSGEVVSAIFEDHEGTIWVATLEGLHRFRDPAVATLYNQTRASRRNSLGRFWPINMAPFGLVLTGD